MAYRLSDTTANFKFFIFDIDYFKDFETDFPAIVYEDALTSDHEISSKHMVSPFDDNEIDFKISFDESNNEDYTFIYDKNSFSYKLISVNDLKMDSKNDNDEVNISSDDVVIEQTDSGIDANVDAQSHEFNEGFETNHDIHRESFTMKDYFIIIKGRMEKIYDRQVHRVQALDLDTLIEEMRRAMVDRIPKGVFVLDTAGTLQFQLTGLDADPLMRPCHRLITFSIAGRSQAPKNVTSTNLFYLRSMDDSIEEVVTETIKEPTLGEYMKEVRADYGKNTTTPKFNNNAKFELGDEILNILRDNSFNGTNGDDVVNHTAKVLAILELIKIPDIDPNQLRMRVFPLSLSGAASNTMVIDEKDDGPDYLDFINWLNSKFRNHRRMDGKTKNALWEFRIKGGDNEVLNDDIISSDDKREESSNTNHPNNMLTHISNLTWMLTKRIAFVRLRRVMINIE
ncbi:hypothetical protein Tco_0723061 [Tanacetum coccineum]